MEIDARTSDHSPGARMDTNARFSSAVSPFLMTTMMVMGTAFRILLSLMTEYGEVGLS